MASPLAFHTHFRFKRIFIRDREMMSDFERNRNKALRRFGSIVRRDARRSLKRGKPSDFEVIFLLTGRRLFGAAAFSALRAKTAISRRKRGGPPVVWTDGTRNGKQHNLKTIWYGLEENNFGDDLMVIGPIGFASGGRPTVPEKLEHGHFPFMMPALERKRNELLKSLLMFGVIN